MEFKDPDKEETKLIIDEKILEKMNNIAMRLGRPPSSELGYRAEQQLMTVAALIEVAGEYNVSIPIEISDELLEGGL